MVKGYCRECGKLDDPEPEELDQNEEDLLCCFKVTKHFLQLVRVSH